MIPAQEKGKRQAGSEVPLKPVLPLDVFYEKQMNVSYCLGQFCLFSSTTAQIHLTVWWDVVLSHMQAWWVLGVTGMQGDYLQN